MIAGQILTFDAAGRRFALPVAEVREIFRAVAVTPLPGAPSVVEGIVDVRGELVPVLDVRVRLGLPKKVVAPTDHFIMTMAGDRALILWVDNVQTLVELAQRKVVPAPDLTNSAEYIAGIAKLPNGLILIQDILRFLFPAEEVALDEAMLRFEAVTE